MNKFFFTASMILIGSTAMAQGPYISANVGYGLGTPSEVLGTESEPGRVTNIYGTLGSGLNFGVTPGYMITEHFGIELGFNYFMGTEMTVNKVTNSFGVNTVMAKSNQFRILPNLVVSSGGERMSVYAKAGLVLPVAGTTFSKVNDTGTNPSPAAGAYTREYETKGSFSLGFSGSIGGTYNLSDKLSLFAELNGVNMRIKAQKRTMTAATQQGQDVLGVMTKSQVETEYEDEVNPLLAQDPAQPTKALATKNNFGAVFINIGVKFNF